MIIIMLYVYVIYLSSDMEILHTRIGSLQNLVNIMERKNAMDILIGLNFERISVEKLIHYFMNN